MVQQAVQAIDSPTRAIKTSLTPLGGHPQCSALNEALKKYRAEGVLAVVEADPYRFGGSWKRAVYHGNEIWAVLWDEARDYRNPFWAWYSLSLAKNSESKEVRHGSEEEFGTDGPDTRAVHDSLGRKHELDGTQAQEGSRQAS